MTFQITITTSASPLRVARNNEWTPPPTLATIEVDDGFRLLDDPETYRQTMQESWQLTRDTGKSFAVRRIVEDDIEWIDVVRLA